MAELFDILTHQFKKVSAVALSATSDAAPQTIVSITTPDLPAGNYFIYYSFQVTHSSRKKPLYFRLDGTYGDAEYFANSAGDNDELHLNRLYGYPKSHLGGVIDLSLFMYKPDGTAVVDFCDIGVRRIG